MRRGDQILKVNDTEIAQAAHKEAARVILIFVSGLRPEILHFLRL